MVWNGEIIAQLCMANIPTLKCGYEVWQTIVHFLSGSTMLNDSTGRVRPLYICSEFYR